MTLKKISDDSIEPVLKNVTNEAFSRRLKGKLIKGILKIILILSQCIKH
jgi:hypothetical protein